MRGEGRETLTQAEQRKAETAYNPFQASVNQPAPRVERKTEMVWTDQRLKCETREGVLNEGNAEGGRKNKIKWREGMKERH